MSKSKRVSKRVLQLSHLEFQLKQLEDRLKAQNKKLDIIRTPNRRFRILEEVEYLTRAIFNMNTRIIKLQ